MGSQCCTKKGLLYNKTAPYFTCTRRLDCSLRFSVCGQTVAKKQIEALGFDTAETKGSLNDVATKALNIIMEANDHSLTNDELYTIYAGSMKNPKDALNYTAFNIKCRPLFNSQQLLRKKAVEGLSSREDIISLNGTPIKKGKSKHGVEKVKNDSKQPEKKEPSKTITLKKRTLNNKKNNTATKEE